MADPRCKEEVKTEKVVPYQEKGTLRTGSNSSEPPVKPEQVPVGQKVPSNLIGVSLTRRYDLNTNKKYIIYF